MRPRNLNTLFREPVQAGIVTGFAGLCAAAAIQLVIAIVGENSGAASGSSMLMAVVLTTVAGITAGYLTKRTSRKQAYELEIAEALAAGDFSKSRPHAQDPTTPMTDALLRIAQRELDSETSRAILAKDAAMRHDQLANALDAVPLEVAVYNRDGLLVGTNSAYLKHCNEIGAIVALGMSWMDVMSAIAKAAGSALPVNERQTWISQQENLREEALAASQPVRFNRMNGRTAELAMSVSVEGNRIELIRDITHICDLEDKMLRATREAAAAESIKQVTISRLSHTIRTPMTGVLAATELLALTELDDRQRERLDIIRRSASTLLGVVQDMFDLAADAREATENRSVLVPEPVKRSALVLELPGKSENVTVDHLRSAGFEVARAESIELLAETIKVLAGQGRHPEGVHVPDAASRDLLLARLGVAHKDAGLNVYVIDRQPEPSAGESAGTAAGKPQLDVLIAESDEVSRIAYANALSSSGLVFRIVGSGAEAIEIAGTGAPRLILLDMTLPDKNGLATSSAIRKAAQPNQSTGPVVAMAGQFVQGDMTKCLASGMDGYVLKPTIGAEMVSLVLNWLQGGLQKAG